MRLYAMDAWVRRAASLTDRERLRETMYAAAESGGATVVGEEFYVFANGAVTGVLVLAQSHLSIHTWPEFGLANIDLLSYGDLRGEVVLRTASRVQLADDALIVREVAAAVGLREGERGVRAVIAALARLEPVSIRRLSRTVALPVPIVAAVCGELRKRFVVAGEPPAQLTLSGRRLFGDGRLRLPGTASCPTCAGRGVVSPGEFSGIARELAELVEKAPPRRLDLDQCQCTVGTKLRRVLAMHEADALVGRRILLLGDDDLTSLAMAAVVRQFGSSSTISRLVVLDADAALVEFLARELTDAPFSCSSLHHDLRDPLPPELLGAFDTVATDPPYTVPAARLFLSRAADALTGPGGSVFLSFGSRRPEAPFRLQQAIAEMGFAIRRLVPDFNDYLGAGALGGTSQLYDLVATADLRSLLGQTYCGPIYTMQVR